MVQNRHSYLKQKKFEIHVTFRRYVEIHTSGAYDNIFLQLELLSTNFTSILQ